MTHRGRVVLKTSGRGSKSEHEAVVLVTDDGEFVLRRPGGNPFADPVLRRLVGKTIECSGTPRDGKLIVSSWKEVAD